MFSFQNLSVVVMLGIAFLSLVVITSGDPLEDVDFLGGARSAAKFVSP